MRATYLILAVITLCAVRSSAQVITLGSGVQENITSAPSPINHYYESIHYQAVYTAAELQTAGAAAGTVTGVAMYITGLPNTVLPDFTIKMANVSQDDMSASYSGPLNTVYGPTDYSPATMVVSSWNNLSLTTSFTWDGTSNVLVDWCYSNQSPWAAAGQILIYVGATGNTPGSRYYRTDGSDACPVTPTMTSGFKPQVQLTFMPLIPCSGTPSAGVITGPSQVVDSVAFLLSASNITIATGMMFQWQVSPSAGGPWTNIPFANSPIDTFTQNADAWYQLISTCTNSGLSNSSNSIYVAIGAPQPCDASFVHYPSTTLYGVQFTSSSTDATAQYNWDFGDGSTSTDSDPVHAYADTGTYIVCLVYEDALDTCSDSYCDTVYVTSSSIVSGAVFYDSNNNGIIDNGDQPAEGINVNAGSYAGETDATGQFIMFLTQGNYPVFVSPPVYYQQSFPSSPSAYAIAPGFNDTIQNLNFLLSSTIAVITGSVYHDVNQNGLRDPSENGIPNQKITWNTGYWNYVFTDSLGDYSIFVLPDTLQLEYILNPMSQAAWMLTNAGGAVLSVIADSAGVVYEGNDFGVYLDSSYHDISITASTLIPPIPGQETTYALHVLNSGLVEETAIVSLQYDTLLAYNWSASSVPTPLAVDPINRTVTYSISIPIGYSEIIFVNFVCDSDAVLTTPVYAVATTMLVAENDDVPINDTAHYQAVVVGSYDPNDKAVNPAGFGDNHTLHPADADVLSYTIRFQNTGTWYATNVLLIDTLDTSTLNVSTLEPVSQSHNCTVQIVNGNILRVFFNNIMLPDSFTDESGSHGYFSFRISPNVGLVNGTVISNSAAIYFDFNDPIFTNDAFITLDESLSIQTVELNGKVLLYPNPADQMLNIETDMKEIRYDLVDLTGRILLSGYFSEQQNGLVDVSSLSSGLYMLRLKGENGLVTRKFTVLHP